MRTSSLSDKEIRINIDDKKPSKKQKSKCAMNWKVTSILLLVGVCVGFGVYGFLTNKHKKPEQLSSNSNKYVTLPKELARFLPNEKLSGMFCIHNTNAHRIGAIYYIHDLSKLLK